MDASLNAAQREAVSTRSGPMLVLAGAGTGKTRVVTHRIAALIRGGVPAPRILAVTFTNKAAREMQQRIRPLLGKGRKEQPVATTFHAQCLQILRRHARRLNYPERFEICDRGDQELYAREALREVRADTATLKPGDLLHWISGWKNQGATPRQAESTASSDRAHLAAMGYRRYQRALRNAGAMDFDDLLVLGEQLFIEHDDVREEEAGRFDHLLVDEYQDTNGRQYQIVKLLAESHRNLCVVGDDDQSIYAWRGAEVRHILNFRRDWPDAKVIQLVENYRSTSAILELANRVIANNQHRHEKQLVAARSGGPRPAIHQWKDESEEAKRVVEAIARKATTPGLSYRDFAILFRTNEHARPFELELRKKRVPYVVVGGESFFDRKEVKDLTCYLRASLFPSEDTAILRILNRPKRGIGDATIDRIRNAAAESSRSVWDILTDAEWTGQLPNRSPAAIAKFVNLLRTTGGHLKQGRPPSQVLRKLMDDAGYESEIQRSSLTPQEQESRCALVEEMINGLAALESDASQPLRLEQFLDDIAIGQREFGDEKSKMLKRDAVVLMTCHSAKGLEFPHVFMPGVEEYRMPHHRSALDAKAIEEERRLFYVGVTRAQDSLTFSMALTRLKWGKPRETHPSRFLLEAIGQDDRAAAVASQVTHELTAPRGSRRAKSARSGRGHKEDSPKQATRRSRR